VTPHNLTNLLHVWRPATANDLSDFLEVPGAEQAGTDDGKETSIVLAPVVETMNLGHRAYA
jgi:hypothetical protein